MNKILRYGVILNAVFPIYPLLTYKSFYQATIMFKYMIFTGSPYKRSPCWGIHQESNRLINYYPFDIEEYRRAYLTFSE
ncbi:unnamed protein product [Rotaria sordida]|uniref:Uncharacterized protein n=1 Tax=Rotaria sordida TaxID=392033 RepID=A0A818Y5Z6_9BILA|nr:unnamed protein product [Rotaria sordida]